MEPDFMQAQPIQKHELVPGLVEARVAVVLNANARQVNEGVLRTLAQVLPGQDVYLSRSALDCRRVVQTVLERGYPLVFTGGGDGTFMSIVNETFRQLEGWPGKRAPRFGVLKLGTGNALAAHVNASGGGRYGVLQDLVRARAGEVPGYRRLDLLQVDGQRAHFAGLGVDGKLLNDYLWVKDKLGWGPLKKVLTGKGGYFSAVAFRTVPHYLVNSSWVECEVVNGPVGEAWRLGPDGQRVGEPVRPGEVIFRGRVMMTAAATVPYYGYGFRMFPFAGQRRGWMHLRMGQLTTGQVLTNLPKLWAGRWFPEGILDFQAQHVTLRYAQPMPFQVGGDAWGYRQQVTLGMAAESVELADFHGPVH